MRSTGLEYAKVKLDATFMRASITVDLVSRTHGAGMLKQAPSGYTSLDNMFGRRIRKYDPFWAR